MGQAVRALGQTYRKRGKGVNHTLVNGGAGPVAISEKLFPAQPAAKKGVDELEDHAGR